MSTDMDQSSTTEQLAEALREMLKHGEHEGACDVEAGKPWCDKHLMAADARENRARAALARYEAGR